jgi:hypothetical protein
VKCYIDNFVRLRSCIRNINNRSLGARSRPPLWSEPAVASPSHLSAAIRRSQPIVQAPIRPPFFLRQPTNAAPLFCSFRGHRCQLPTTILHPCEIAEEIRSTLRELPDPTMVPLIHQRAAASIPRSHRPIPSVSNTTMDPLLEPHCRVASHSLPGAQEPTMLTVGRRADVSTRKAA